MAKIKWYNGTDWVQLEDASQGMIKITSNDTKQAYIRNKFISTEGIAIDLEKGNVEYDERIQIRGIPATTTTLGMIKVGSNLEISSDGVLSATGGNSTGDGKLRINTSDTVYDYLQNKLQFSAPLISEYVGGSNPALLVSGRVATTSSLGFVKVGDGINVDEAGTISIVLGENTPEEIDAFIASKGVADGLATLDPGGKVPSSQLPSYVDDVEEYNNFEAFPDEGSTGKIYVDIDEGITYRWSGTQYIQIGGGRGISGPNTSIEGNITIFDSVDGSSIADSGKTLNDIDSDAFLYAIIFGG